VGSANAGMSSVKADEKSAHRKPKVSYGRVIRVGLGGPNPRPKGVGDGQTVSIPSLPTFVETTRTQSGNLSVPIGHGAFLPYSKGAGGVETTVKATGAGLSWLEKPVVEQAMGADQSSDWKVTVCLLHNDLASYSLQQG
jgi:hypothetical protein